MTLPNAAYSATLPIWEGFCMLGGIYTDQRCVVCNAILKDTGRDVSCPMHPQVKASRFRVKFGKDG